MLPWVRSVETVFRRSHVLCKISQAQLWLTDRAWRVFTSRRSFNELNWRPTPLRAKSSRWKYCKNKRKKIDTTVLNLTLKLFLRIPFLTCSSLATKLFLYLVVVSGNPWPSVTSRVEKITDWSITVEATRGRIIGQRFWKESLKTSSRSNVHRKREDKRRDKSIGRRDLTWATTRKHSTLLRWRYTRLRYSALLRQTCFIDGWLICLGLGVLDFLRRSRDESGGEKLWDKDTTGSILSFKWHGWIQPSLVPAASWSSSSSSSSS